MADDQTLSNAVTPIDNAPSPGATDVSAPSSGDTDKAQGESKESLLEAVQKAVPELRKDERRRRLGGWGLARPSREG